VLLPFWYAWQHKDALALLIITTFALAMVTEIYFDRTVGSMATGFFIPLVLSDKRKRQP
jgi:O-antigen ligase